MEIFKSKEVTALSLYKFIQDNNLEIDWRGKGNGELILWVNFHNLKEFAEMIGYTRLSDGGIDTVFLIDSVAFDIVPLCERWEIEPTDIKAREV